MAKIASSMKIYKREKKIRKRDLFDRNQGWNGGIKSEETTCQVQSNVNLRGSHINPSTSPTKSSEITHKTFLESA